MTKLQDAITSAATNAILDVLDQQPWYKRYAGTITTAAGGVVAFGTWLATSGIGLPPTAQVVLGAVVLVASVVAARATKNGQTPRTTQDTLDAILPSVIDAVQNRGGLDDLLQEKASEAATSALDRLTTAAKEAVDGVGLPPIFGDVAGTVADAVRGAASEAERAFLGRG